MLLLRGVGRPTRHRPSRQSCGLCSAQLSTVLQKLQFFEASADALRISESRVEDREIPRHAKNQRNPTWTSRKYRKGNAKSRRRARWNAVSTTATKNESRVKKKNKNAKPNKKSQPGIGSMNFLVRHNT